VAMGSGSTATARDTLAVGEMTTASGEASVALGQRTLSSGPFSVAMGSYVTSDAYNSVAMGLLASTGGFHGSFVYGDRSTVNGSQSVVVPTAENQFVVRAAGGFQLRTSGNLSTGCNLPAGSGTWACTSSMTTKHLFGDVDGEALLARLQQVPVRTWSYVTEDGGVRHMGPFAEDFRSAFGLGVNDVSIGLQDIDGVNLAAVKALVERTDRLLRENAAQSARIQTLEAEMAALRAALLGSGREN
jgi:trimeric autotransporter adhesin